MPIFSGSPEILATLNIVDDQGLVAPGKIGFGDQAFRRLDCAEGTEASVEQARPVSAARLLRGAGAAKLAALATHCLAASAELQAQYDADIASVRATDSVCNPVGTLPIAPFLAEEIRRLGWDR